MAEPYVANISPEMAELSNAAKVEALRRALRSGSLGLGAGAGLTALLATLQKKRQIPFQPSVEVDMPYPQLGPGPTDSTGVKRADLAAEIILAQPLKGGLFGAAGSFRGAMHAAEALATGEKAKLKEKALLRGGLRGLIGGGVAVPTSILGSSLARKGLLKLNPAAGGLAQFAAVLAGSSLGAAASMPYGSPIAEAATNKLLGPARERRHKKADIAEDLVKHYLATEPGKPMPTVGTPEWFRGDTHTNPDNIPWALPARVGAGLTGLGGGHHLIKHLLRKDRKDQLQAALATAKKEYEDALLSQYSPEKTGHMEAKAASVNPNPAATLDRIYDALTKHAGDINDTLGQLAGLYLTGAGGLAAASGVGTYNWLQSRSGHKLLDKTLKRRATIRGLGSPQAIYINPVARPENTEQSVAPLEDTTAQERAKIEQDRAEP